MYDDGDVLQHHFNNNVNIIAIWCETKY